MINVVVEYFSATKLQTVSYFVLNRSNESTTEDEREQKQGPPDQLTNQPAKDFNNFAYSGWDKFVSSDYSFIFLYFSDDFIIRFG